MFEDATDRAEVTRRRVIIRGTVQGVGFRPYVYALARRLGLAGFVRNRADGVEVEVEGEAGALDRFVHDLGAGPSPPARVESVRWSPRPARGDAAFRIEESDPHSSGPNFIAADLATCDACLAEISDPADRRFRYAFTNCSHCGPRLTILRAVPYDRGRTTMAAFAMCPACAAEYADPSDRRFHAQPTACPACGPRLAMRDRRGRSVPGGDVVSFAAAALRDGRIAAIKGLGGYHLACDARRDDVVAELRRRKGRDEKAFAVMVADVAAAERLCFVAEAERRLLAAPERPIVLMRRRPGTQLARAVAPGNPDLGIMLPYMPLHHLLLRDLGGIPLVMTSGNRSDEPIAYEDEGALERLAGVADVFVTHDRPIHLRCDDSVVRVVAGAELPVRRSRGYTPRPLRLPRGCTRRTLALGGQQKVTFALGRGRHAVLSHHIGDLDQYAGYQAYGDAIDHYERLFGFIPELIVHDLHPEYASTRYARERVAAGGGMAHMAVQHHHAHLASCLAEHGLDGPAIGVIFDGTGYGSDGAIWGGEFLVGAFRGFRRAAHLRYVPMPGGERAIREPWRMAVAHLLDAGLQPDQLAGRVGTREVTTVGRMIERGLNAPPTSSVGRLFDAVAALAGIRQRVSYEGQAAIELEWRASEAGPEAGYPFELCEPGGAPMQVDTRPLIAAVAADVHNKSCPERIARRFHSALVEMIVQVCRCLRQDTGLDRVALSGGVFMNALLLTEAVERLEDDGFHVYRHRVVPPNDGGLSLGQLAVAAAQETEVNGVPGDSR